MGLEQFVTKLLNVKEAVTIFALKQEREKLKKATMSYSKGNPEMGQYGIGYHRVTTEFDEL
jgi:hypothetical protein